MTVSRPCPDLKQAVTPNGVFSYTGALVLYFYPKDNTPGCTTEAIEFAQIYPQFQQLGFEVVGVSRDSLRSHENFSRKLNLPFPLISDPDEALCTAFGVMKLKNMYGKQVRGIERSTFLINAQQQIIHEWRGVKAKGHAETVLNTARQYT